MRFVRLTLIGVTWLASLPVASAQDQQLAVDLPAELRQWFRNPDGSCVQCSIGMCGVDQNVPAAATLLWDTDYGPRERGGSYPSRVAAYSQRRGIRIYNVTGQNTWELDEVGGGDRARRRDRRRHRAFPDADGLRPAEWHLVRLQQQQSAADRSVRRGGVSEAASGERPVGGDSRLPAASRTAAVRAVVVNTSLFYSHGVNE